MKKALFIALLLVPVLALAQVTIVPEKPTAGSAAVLELEENAEAAEVFACSPMGAWFQRFDPSLEKQMLLNLPADLPVLLVGLRKEGSASLLLRYVELQGSPQQEVQKWRAYFNSGEPRLGAIRDIPPLSAEDVAEILASVTGDGGAANHVWQQAIQTQQPSARAKLLLDWLEKHPMTPIRTRALQLLAGTYAEMYDHQRTIHYGRMTLQLMPTDAMTLNGVAYASAQAGLDMEEGLLLSDRALTILSASDQLQKPSGMTSAQWRREILNAQAATMDTHALLLTRLGRYSEAQRYFVSALAKAQRDEIYLHYGLMLKESGKTDEATSILEAGLALAGPHAGEIESALASIAGK